jgi:hypothetical protein
VSLEYHTRLGDQEELMWIKRLGALLRDNLASRIWHELLRVWHLVARMSDDVAPALIPELRVLNDLVLVTSADLDLNLQRGSDAHPVLSVQNLLHEAIGEYAKVTQARLGALGDAWLSGIESLETCSVADVSVPTWLRSSTETSIPPLMKHAEVLRLAYRRKDAVQECLRATAVVGVSLDPPSIQPTDLWSVLFPDRIRSFSRVFCLQSTAYRCMYLRHKASVACPRFATKFRNSSQLLKRRNLC